MMCTNEKLVEMLHDASEAVSSSFTRELLKEAALVIERQTDLLKPFAKEADEYNGWAGLVMVEADEEGGVREAWYSMADLRKAREEVLLWYRLPKEATNG